MFVFKNNMKISLNSIHYNNLISVGRKSFPEKKENESKIRHFGYSPLSCQSFKGDSINSTVKPISYSDKIKKDEMAALTPLMRGEDKKFSLDKAADMLKTKIDKQLLPYSETDIELAVRSVTAKFPDVTREEALYTISKMGSFSNYESLSHLETFLEKENIKSFITFKDITINSILMYLCAPSKQLLKLPSGDEPGNRAVVADRNTIRSIKRMKENPNTRASFNNLFDAVNKGKVKLILLDGWEAKTKDGYKSFNFAGAWGNLSQAAASIIKEQKEGKNPFNDDIICDLKDLFGEDVNINIIKNPIENLNSKSAADRLNSKSISKKHIIDFIEGLSTFGIPTKSKPKIVRDFDCEMSTREIEFIREVARISKLSNSMQELQKYKDAYLSKAINFNEVDLKAKRDLQEQLMKVLYCSVNVYSPRRIAKELKILNYNINENAQIYGKTMKDALFIIPNREKSFGLINYQNSKVNDIDDSQMVYIYDHNTPIDKNLKDGKFFVYMDDFAGSGQSLVEGSFRYVDFRLRNPHQTFVFAPIAYTKSARDRINRAIFSAKIDLRQRNVRDILIGVTQIDELDDYINLLPSAKKSLLRYCFHKGFKKNSANIAFPHVVPDNCSDSTGILLENILKNKKANKAKSKTLKRDLIEYAASRQNN